MEKEEKRVRSRESKKIQQGVEKVNQKLKKKMIKIKDDKGNEIEWQYEGDKGLKGQSKQKKLEEKIDEEE